MYVTHRWRVMAVVFSTFQASKLRQQSHGTHRASSCRDMYGRSTIPVALACILLLDNRLDTHHHPQVSRSGEIGSLQEQEQ